MLHYYNICIINLVIIYTILAKIKVPNNTINRSEYDDITWDCKQQ